MMDDLVWEEKVYFYPSIACPRPLVIRLTRGKTRFINVLHSYTWKIHRKMNNSEVALEFRLKYDPNRERGGRRCLQFSSVTQSCPTVCDPMNHSTPGLPVHHQLPEFTQTHAHRVSDAIQPSHPLLSPFPPALNLSQHHSLFKWVSSSHQVAKVLEFQLQHQSFQWTPRTDLL